MKLENKNLFYSLLLATVLVVLLVGYFIFMLPSLYLDYMDEQNLAGVIEQQKAYLSTHSYDDVALKNPTACFTVEIPDEGQDLIFTNNYVSARIALQDQEMLDILQDVRTVFRNVNQGSSDDGGDDDTKKEQEYDDIIQRITTHMSNEMGQLRDAALPVSLEILRRRDGEDAYRYEDIRYHLVSDDIFVVEAKAGDAQNEYTTYLAMTNTESSVVLSVLPAMSTRMGEIRDVVLNSLPMIVAVIVLLVLLFSYLYSTGIIKPLFAEVKRQNDELDEKNRLLREENKRQEVFLRASSHQLKTPIAAALLLVDGMISKVGKFRDYETYLPKVKEQLLSMRTMVEDILSLKRSKELVRKEAVDATVLLQTLLATYEVECRDKGIQIKEDLPPSCMMDTDADMFMKIMDNLVSNAVHYAEANSEIHICLNERVMEIENRGHIPEEIEEHLFEPFVSGNTGNRSHGLGLYIVAYYAGLLDMSVAVQNVGELVVTELHL